jgi:branched-chain amino acid transport system permease protein
MRQVVFSLALLLVIIFFRQGLLGRREFSWGAVSRMWHRIFPASRNP